MAHEGITPILIRGSLGPKSHSQLLEIANAAPDSLKPPSSAITHALLGRFSVWGAPIVVSHNDKAAHISDDFYEESRSQGVEPFDTRTLELLTEITNRFRQVRLGGTGIRAVALLGMNPRKEALNIRLTGLLEDVAKDKLAFVDQLRNILLGVEDHPLFRADSESRVSIDLRFERKQLAVGTRAEDEAFYRSFAEMLQKIKSLDFRGHPSLAFGPTYMDESDDENQNAS